MKRRVLVLGSLTLGLVGAVAAVGVWFAGRDTPPAGFDSGRDAQTSAARPLSGRPAVTDAALPDFVTEIERLILSAASDADLEQEARSRGMLTMYEAGMAKVWTGMTTIDEVLSVTRTG